MNVVVDGDDRGKSACAEAGDCFHGEHQGVGGFFGLGKSELLPEPCQDRRRLSDMTGGSVAYLDNELPLWLEREILVERGNAEQPCLSDPEPRTK